MTYSPDIPQDLPPPNVIVDQIRTNFAQFTAVLGNNHSAMNTSTQGKHEGVVLENQTQDPGVTNSYDALYQKTVATASSTQPELFLQIPQFLPNAQPNLAEQLTFNSVNTVGPQYQTFLPGGYIMYFGSISSVPDTITLSPACSEIVCAIANANNLTTVGTPIPFDAFSTITGPNTFTINSNFATGAYTFTWIAIGKQ